MDSLGFACLIVIVHLKAKVPCPFAACRPIVLIHSLTVFISSIAIVTSKGTALATISTVD
jgi:hypothetical protein